MSSVPDSKRSELDDLTVLIDARELASYTSVVLSNPKKFDPNRDPALLSRLRNTAYDIPVKLFQANKLNPFASESERKLRWQCQEEALLACNEFLTLLFIAKKTYHISSQRMCYWTELMRKVRNKIVSWITSDANRYGQPNVDIRV